MTLKPRQIIGLVAVVVFGAIAVWRFTQPSEREIMERRLASLPSPSALLETPDFPVATLPPVNIPTAPDLSRGDGADSSGEDRPIWELSGIDHYNLGSQPAKDDLYCAGVLGAEFDAIVSTAHPDASSLLLRDMQALEAAGVAKLKAEGQADDRTSAGFMLAWADKAKKDRGADALRLSVADCTARAATLAAGAN